MRDDRGGGDCGCSTFNTYSNENDRAHWINKCGKCMTLDRAQCDRSKQNSVWVGKCQMSFECQIPDYSKVLIIIFNIFFLPSSSRFCVVEASLVLSCGAAVTKIEFPSMARVNEWVVWCWLNRNGFRTFAGSMDREQKQTRHTLNWIDRHRTCACVWNCRMKEWKYELWLVPLAPSFVHLPVSIR